MTFIPQFVLYPPAGGSGDMAKTVYDPAAKNAQLAAVTDLHANTNDPTADQKAALAGSSGTPSVSNKFITDADTRNSNDRTPTAHDHDASGIASGILDGDRLPAISATKKGGVPLTGTPSGKYLKDDATWAAPTATVNIKQTEIDFGATPISEKSFTITDADVVVTSQLIGNVAYEAPTGKELDELEMDSLDLKFAPGAGQFMLYAKGLDGYVADCFKINFLVG